MVQNTFMGAVQNTFMLQHVQDTFMGSECVFRNAMYVQDTCMGAMRRKPSASHCAKGNSNSHGARPVHLIITMIRWIRTSRLSIKNSLSTWEHQTPDDLKNPESCVFSYATRWSRRVSLTPYSGVLRDRVCTAQGPKVSCVRQVVF